MVCSVEDFGGQSNEQFCPVEDQEGSFSWKSWSSEWLPLTLYLKYFCSQYIVLNQVYLHFNHCIQNEEDDCVRRLCKRRERKVVGFLRVGGGGGCSNTCTEYAQHTHVVVGRLLLTQNTGGVSTLDWTIHFICIQSPPHGS